MQEEYVVYRCYQCQNFTHTGEWQGECPYRDQEIFANKLAGNCPHAQSKRVAESKVKNETLLTQTFGELHSGAKRARQPSPGSTLI